ncbi:MAG: type ISP restriction/modification enzyme [Ktedonobacteraceae bacterium]
MQEESQSTEIDNFVNNNPAFVKWTDRLKAALTSKQVMSMKLVNVRNSLYRPFCKQHIYFDHVLNQRRYQQHLMFSSSVQEVENTLICVSGIGSSKPFHCLAADMIACLDLLEKTQCFPYYTYAEDGSNRRENITDWALAQFRAAYGDEVTKWDIFHYVYAMLHHPQYRERYAENLKRELPRIPLLGKQDEFVLCVRVGKQLMELHLNYESAAEYPLKWVENRDVPVNWRVEKMRLSPGKDTLVVNEWLTLAGIPQTCYQYRLGNRSALEWVIDQYQVSKDKRSEISSDPNREDEPEYIVRLVGRVVTVSVKTVKLVDELAGAVAQEDWIGEEVVSAESL